MLQDPDLPLVFTRQLAIRHGMTANAVSWRAARGSWRTLRRGAFCLSEIYDQSTPELRHLLTALAALAIDGRHETMSHLTAALAYGWPGPLDLDEDPWFTIGAESSLPTRRRSGVVRQVASRPPEHIRTFDALSVTSPARTVADTLRHFPARVSLPIADAAARDGVALSLVGRILDWQAGWPYVDRGRRTAELIDGRRESWLESQSAVAHHELGLPMPVPQAVVVDERGRLVARVDFLWPDYAVIGEADGWGKYRVRDEAEAPVGSEPLTTMAALREEKAREDRLRDLGYQVVRWGTADALNPRSHLADRLGRAFDRGDPSSVRGSFSLTPAKGGPGPELVRLAELREKARPHGLLAVPPLCSTSVGEKRRD